MTTATSATHTQERTAAIASQFKALEGPLLPILHAVQHEFGHVPEEALRTIAVELNLSRAEVHGVASFYHDFRAQPAGRHVLKICRAEACQSMGANELAAHIETAHKLKLGETTPDGALTVEAVYCLGLCACAPAAMLDGKVAGRLDAAKLDTLIAKART